MSVGSNVLLKYGLYVVCHLSKWFTFSSLFNGHFLLCRCLNTLAANVLGLAEGGGLEARSFNLALMLIRSTNVE